MSELPWSAKDSKDTIDDTDKLMLLVPSEALPADQNKTITGANIQIYTENITLHTGIKKGMEKTINADTTRFDVSAGNAIKVDKTDPLNVIVTKLSFTGVTAQLDTNLGEVISHLYVDIVTGTVTTELNPPTLSDILTRIYLGELIHDSGIIVQAVSNAIFAYGSSETEIVGLAFGDAETLVMGDLTPNGANLMLNTEASTVKEHGRGFDQNPTRPNISEVPGESPIAVGNFFLIFIDVAGDIVNDASSNVLDPTQFNEDGLGVLETVSNIQFTKIRVFEAGGTNDRIFYYGTEEFSSSMDALNDIGTVWVEHENTRDIAPKAIITIREDVTNIATAEASGFYVRKNIRTRSQL